MRDVLIDDRNAVAVDRDDERVAELPERHQRAIGIDGHVPLDQAGLRRRHARAQPERLVQAFGQRRDLTAAHRRRGLGRRR